MDLAMAEVEIFTTMMCPYCYRAKALLEAKNVPYKEIDVSLKPQLRAEMTRRAGGRHTVPQIFVNGSPIGGCDDLFLLERQGKLDSLLQIA